MVFIGRHSSAKRGTPVVSAPPVVPSLDEPAELRRQEAVDSLGLSEHAEDRYDRIVDMARSLYHTELAAFSVIDGNREWFKSSTGSALTQVDRCDSFCSVMIQEEGALVVADTTLDPRFSSNPGVTGPMGIRFYAGVPILSRDGVKVGALCVSSTEPRTDVDAAILEQLALLIQAELTMTPSYSSVG